VGGSRGPHCHAHNEDESWMQLKERVVISRQISGIDVAKTGGVVRPQSYNPYMAMQNNPYKNIFNRFANLSEPSSMHMADLLELTRHELNSGSAGNNRTPSNRGEISFDGANGGGNRRQKKDMRIPEVFLENFRNAAKISDGSSVASAVDLTSPVASAKSANDGESCMSSGEEIQAGPIIRKKVEGDIPSLRLYNTFFVEGIKIGWPFPAVMKPQRQMAIHLVKALKNRRHVVLESPTGTGKSAAILCSVLAWQRHHHKALFARHDPSSPPNSIDLEPKPQKVKIIYCSRTHSQVAQMVSSLKSTPYRPRMAILGSRERLCIHKSIKPRGNYAEIIPGINVTNECRNRTRNTEKTRRRFLSTVESDQAYDDDDPPDDLPGDGDGGGGGEESAENQFLSRKKTCPHYRQLTSGRIANLVNSTFVPNNKVDCCSVGGKKSTYGAHDIEDLVSFGVDPYLQKNVAFYRENSSQPFGLELKVNEGRRRGCYVKGAKKGFPADNGTLKEDDKILRVNGSNVAHMNSQEVAEMIRDSSNNPLLLDISRGGSGTLSSSDGRYSPHAACPYYISQALAKDAEIVFAPYNYVLDPGIRDALGIELMNSVVILDEAHNVEDTLREAGSGKFGEFELCELVVMLNNYALTEKSTGNMIELEPSGVPGDASGDVEYLCDLSHSLLIFIEKLIEDLRKSRTVFENNPGAKGAQKALRDYERFHSPDDTEYEIIYDGPTGNGVGGKAVGCLGFFQRLGLSKSDFEKLLIRFNSLDKFHRGRDGSEEAVERDRTSNLFDRLGDLISKLYRAVEAPEHFYAAIVASANGSLEFASGGEPDVRGKSKPTSFPLIPPKTIAHPDRIPNPCLNQHCRAVSSNVFSPVRHGSYCDGSTPKWQAFLCLRLLTPGPLFSTLAQECHSVVLASGSLSPIPSLCAELSLFPADSGPEIQKASSSPPKDLYQPASPNRLQNHPRPLQADHVVDLKKQLFAVTIGHFPDGSELKVTHSNYSKPGFLEKLGKLHLRRCFSLEIYFQRFSTTLHTGDAIVKIVEGIPSGGVLVFLPSYSLLRKCERLWNPDIGNTQSSFWSDRFRDPSEEPSIWDRLKAAKHNVVVEPSGGQDLFEAKKEEYMESVRIFGGCVLLAVYRGKMSEGISFNDENARSVVCVGLPLPNPFSLSISAKKNYNDEQRKLQKRTDLLPGQEWYNQQAYRAIAQALGRCIRHAADYGAIFLLDGRHCDDGSPSSGVPRQHQNFPKWMVNSLKNLSEHSTGINSMLNYTSSSEVILGGWKGLKRELQRFFLAAKPYSVQVMQNHSANVQSARGQSQVIKSRTNNTSFEMRDTSDRTTKNKDLDSLPQKGNTLQDMFRRQMEVAPTAKIDRNFKVASKEASASSHKVTNKIESPMNLKAFFDKQIAAARSSAPGIEDPKQSASNSTDIAEPVDSTQPGDFSSTKSHQKSPSTRTTPPPATEPMSASQSQCNQVEDHLCVVCEDAKKEVILLPCKHLCLCKGCSNFDMIKECPMCRSKIADSMIVFW